MRIGLFSDYYLGSSDGTAIASEISRQALSDLKHQVLVFCPKTPKSKEKKYVRALPSVPGCVYPGLRICWPFGRRSLNMVQTAKLDIIHIETPLPIGLLGLWAGRKLGKPVVISAHLDMDFMGEYGVAPLALFGLGVLVALICRQPLGLLKVLFSRRRDPRAGRRVDFAWRIFAYLCDQADICVAISQKIYDQLNLYKQNDKLVLVPNGVSLPHEKLPSQAACRRELGWAKDDFVVISLARLVREKRVELIVGSLKRLSEKPKIKLAILNDGPQIGYLKQLVAQLGVEDRVYFYGLLPRQDLYKYLVAADVFVSASRREVASLAILEAALCAKPLLLFDERLVEPLEDGANGFFINSPKQLADKINWLMDNPKKSAAFGSASRTRVRNRYSQAAHGRALDQLYAELLKER